MTSSDAVEDVRARLESGDSASIESFFQGMPEKERRSFVKPVTEHLRSLEWSAYPESGDADVRLKRYEERRANARSTQLPAALAVMGGAAALAKYIARLEDEISLDPEISEAVQAVQAVLTDRDPAWLAELADRVCEAMAAAQQDGYWLVTAIADAAGVTPAASPRLLQLWWRRHWWYPGWDDKAERFLQDPRLAEILPLAIDDDEGSGADWAEFGETTLTVIARGAVPRAAVLDASLRRLLRGGRPGVMRERLGFLAVLEPTDAEIAERTTSCISLLSSQDGTVARTFLASLKKASDAGLIDLDRALEAAALAVTRPEKNIVKTALGWLDTLAAAHPDRSAEIAGHIATAFGAPGADLQERAVKLIGKHAGLLGESDRQRLVAEAKIHLAPDLAASLTGLLGVERAGVTQGTGYLGIAPYAPRPLPPPIESPAELAEIVGSLVRRNSQPSDPMILERVLEAFVTFQRTDAASLQEAMAPITEPQRSGFDRGYPLTPRTALYWLAKAAGTHEDTQQLPDRASMPQLWSWIWDHDTDRYPRRGATPAEVLTVRIAEIHAAFAMTGLPPLVSVPTSSNGTIAAQVLATRLRQAESEGWVPLQADFHQALLRLPRDCGDLDTSGFTSEAGRRFAAWVAGDRTEMPVPEMPDPAARALPGAETPQSGKYLALNERFKGFKRFVPQSLLDLVPVVWDEPVRVWDGSDWDLCWPAILPSHSDLPALALAGSPRPGNVDHGSPEAVVALAEQDDRLHTGTHFLIAWGLIHQDARQRAAGVDAALILAARGLLDPVRLAEDLATGLHAESGLPRLVPCLRDLANGGATGQTWGTIAHLLPHVLPPAVPKAPPGTADLLSLATELAAAQQTRTPIAEVTGAAEKKGSGAVTSAAQRLDAVLRA